MFDKTKKFVRDRWGVFLAAWVGLSVWARVALAAVGLSAVIAGGLYTSTTTSAGFAHHLDKQANPIPVRYVLTCVLPAYTETGSAGSEVLTANANGALPASCTDGVTGLTNDRVGIVYNDTSFPDAGVFVLTQGDGSNPWVLTRSTVNGENTGARLAGSTLRVTEGHLRGLWYCDQSAITVGTTGILFLPADQTRLYPINAAANFSERQAVLTGSASGSSLAYGGFGAFFTGAAASITVGTDGVGTFSTGSTSAGVAQLIAPAIDPTLARYVGDYDVTFSVPGPVSDGTNTYAVRFGFANDANNFARIDLTPTAGADITFVTTVGGVAGATRTLCTGCFSLSAQYRLNLRKPFGSSVWDIWFDPGTGSLGFIDVTPTLPTSVFTQTTVAKSVGPAARTMTSTRVRAKVIDPKGFWG